MGYDCLTRGFTIYIYIYIRVDLLLCTCLFHFRNQLMMTTKSVNCVTSMLRLPLITFKTTTTRMHSSRPFISAALRFLLSKNRSSLTSWLFLFSLSFAHWLDVNSCVWCSVFPWSIITPNFSSHKSLLSHQTKSAKGLTSVKLRLRPLLLKSIKETARLAARLSPRLSPNSRILRLRFATFLLLSQTNSVSQTFTKNYIYYYCCSRYTTFALWMLQLKIIRLLLKECKSLNNYQDKVS